MYIYIVTAYIKRNNASVDLNYLLFWFLHQQCEKRDILTLNKKFLMIFNAIISSCRGTKSRTWSRFWIPPNSMLATELLRPPPSGARDQITATVAVLRIEPVRPMWRTNTHIPLSHGECIYALCNAVQYYIMQCCTLCSAVHYTMAGFYLTIYR